MATSSLTLHRVTKVTIANYHHTDELSDFHTLMLRVTDADAHETEVTLFSVEPLNIEKS